MKNAILFALIILSQACGTVEKTPPPLDPVNVQLRDSLHWALGTIEKLLIRGGVKDSAIYAYVDTLQKELLRSQTDVIRLHYVQIQLKLFVAENKALIAKLQSYQIMNSSLNEANVSISDTVKNMRIRNYKLRSENNSLKQSIKFKIAAVQVKSWGYKRARLFKKFVLDTVSTAKQTKFIEASFVVVANDRLEKTTYTVTVRIKGVHGRGISKDKDIVFDGSEQLTSVKFDDPQAFEIGYHHVEITNKDNENLYPKELGITLK